MRTGGADEISERFRLQGCGCSNPDEIVRYLHEGHEIRGRIVGQPFVYQRIDGDDPRERHQEGMRVAGRKKRGHRGDAVPALFVLYDHRLAPALGEVLRKQAAGNVGAGPGRERDDQLDRALRPALSRTLAGWMWQARMRR